MEYIYEIEMYDCGISKRLFIAIKYNNKNLTILETFINTDISIREEKILNLLNNIEKILNGEGEEYDWLGEICAIYVYKEKCIIVDTLSGYNYDEEYEGYDYPDATPPDICDYEEIETIELKNILVAWYDAITNN
ncbi:MAG: hypothetical protein K2H66_01910 [Oscillospiraceae bacterium]|nr:hypothetical protein [Oscillospiraceae bacterium]